MKKEWLQKIKCFIKGHKWEIAKFQVISDDNLNFECAECGKLI